MPTLPELTIGGGINWQNHVFEDVSAPDGSSQYVYQGSYPLANLFDRSCDTYMNNYVYDEPRNFSVSMTFQF